MAKKKGGRQHKAKPSSGGTRKYGRNRVKCQAYRSRGQREKNKARKAKKRL